jgi:predicted nucleic acid-binding protein
MKGKYFIDSNVILYCYMKDVENKAALALRLLNNDNCIISSQVVGEVCNNLKKKSGFSPDELKQVIGEFYNEFTVIPVEFDIYYKATELLNRFSLSFWDSVIVSAAILGGADILYSEDMQNELVIESVKIVNPFNTTKILS